MDNLWCKLQAAKERARMPTRVFRGSVRKQTKYTKKRGIVLKKTGQRYIATLPSAAVAK